MVSFYRMGFVVKVSDLLEKPHQIYWFSGCDLHLPEAPGLRKPLAILQKTSKNFRNLCILKKFWRFFENLVSFLAFHFADWHSSPKEMIFMKNTSDLLAFWLWFSRPSENIFLNFCILNNFWRFLKNSLLCLMSDDEWFWKNSRDFWKILHYVWWVMMSDDEWWWVMMSDDEWWWVMMSDDQWW